MSKWPVSEFLVTLSVKRWEHVDLYVEARTREEAKILAAARYLTGDIPPDWDLGDLVNTDEVEIEVHA